MDEMMNMEFTREQMIAALINAQYTVDDQIAILRQKDTKPEEYQAFFDFAKDVKDRVTATYAAKAAAE